MKKTIVVTVSIIAFIAAIAAVAWNIVIVVATYPEGNAASKPMNPSDPNFQFLPFWQQRILLDDPSLWSTSPSKRIVVIKQRLLTGETWAEYIE